MKMDSRLILALDETDGAKALKVAESVSGIVDAIKINWPLVLSEGPGMITRLSELSEVVCDFKVADIPNTVRLIVENAVSRGASGVIVHAFTGDDSLRAAVEAAGGADIYAVTEMSHPGGKMFTALHAEEMARLGVECGVSGFIAPATRPERIAAIREVIGERRTPYRPAQTTSSWAAPYTAPRTRAPQQRRSPRTSARSCEPRGPCDPSLLLYY